MKMIIIFFALLWVPDLQAQQTDNDSIMFVDPQILPEYPGGEVELMKYLGTIKYPQEEMNSGIESSVYVKFVIEKDGSIEDVKVARNSWSRILDEAAIAHVKNMPKWKPSTIDGIPVRAEYAVPIKFVLPD